MPPKPKQMSDYEELPEADRLEGFVHPRDTQDLFGHKDQLEQIGQAWLSGRMHHGWMLAGPSGIGKATFAYHMARIILNYDMRKGEPSMDVPGADSSVVRQVQALSHPNLLLIRRGWNQKDKKFPTAITVDEVRKLRNFVGMTAQEGSWRVVIVDRADEMNANAANALLKSLEEPPVNCVFFLITEAAGKMPPTIRSRCRKLDFNPLGMHDLRLAVQNACAQAEMGEVDPVKLKTLSQITQGSVRQTLELLDGKGLESYETLISLFKTLPKMDYAQVHSLAEKLATPAALADFEMFFTLLSDLIRRLIRVGAGNGEAPEAEIHIALKYVTQDTLAHWAGLWETLSQEKREALGLNLDKKNFLMEAFRKVENTARMAVGTA